MAKDPVCAMEVDEKQAVGSSAHRGKTFFFCCGDCKREFDANPGRYHPAEVRSVSTESLARSSARRPWRVIGLWAAALFAGIVLAVLFLGDGLTTGFAFTNNPESKRADVLLEERIGDPNQVIEIVIVGSETLTVDDPAFRSRVEGMYGDIMALGPEVVEAGINYYETPNPALVSADGRTMLVPLVMQGELEEAGGNVSRVHEIVDQAADRDGFSVLIAGEATLMEDFNTVAENDFRSGELIGLATALVVLLLVFGAVTRAIIPVVLGATTVAVAMGAAAVIGLATPLYFLITIMISMIGLALGIDYSLFILSRYQEERRQGLEKIDAIGRAGASASRAVLFSGMTTVVALLAMFIVPVDVFRSMAIGAALAAVVAVLAALTLLPAIISAMGERIFSLSISSLWRKVIPGRPDRATAADAGQGAGFWDAIAAAVMRRPVISIVLAGGLMLAATVPIVGMGTGMAGADTFPDYTRSKESYLVLKEQFAAGIWSPVEIVIDGDAGSEAVQAGIERLEASLAEDPRFGPSSLDASPDGTLAVLSAPTTSTVMAEDSYQAVKDLRADYVPRAFSGVDAEVLVTGSSAWHVDFFAATNRYIPFVIAFVLALSFILLTLVFRSLVVPIKSIVLNLLSVGAAYGLLVLVFQEGVGAGLLGFQQVDKIEAWLPLFLFAILFGLSMDYHVFILSRIRERFDETGDNNEAVAFGLRSTGAVITGAAAIMVAVFGGFALGDLVATQQVGFGLAVAVFLDATLVRSVLLPATMKLLGPRNWWLPRALRWLPHVGIEGRPALAAR